MVGWLDAIVFGDTFLGAGMSDEERAARLREKREEARRKQEEETEANEKMGGSAPFRMPTDRSKR